MAKKRLLRKIGTGLAGNVGSTLSYSKLQNVSTAHNDSAQILR